jgi:hypothetical protein
LELWVHEASSSTLLINVMESWIFKHCFDDWSQVRV